MSLPIGEIATGLTIGVGALAAWLDLRRRTDGNGPLGTRMAVLESKIEANTDHLKDVSRYFIEHLDRHAEKQSG